MKGSSSNKGKIFDQEGSTMDLIGVEPLSSAPPTSLVPYNTSEDEVLVAHALSLKEKLPIDSQDAESPNLGDNLVQTSLEIVVPDTETEEDPSE